jgi:hypothetical protein
MDRRWFRIVSISTILSGSSRWTHPVSLAKRDDHHARSRLVGLQSRLLDPSQQVCRDRPRLGFARDGRPPTGSVGTVAGGKDVGCREEGGFDLIEPISCQSRFDASPARAEVGGTDLQLLVDLDQFPIGHSRRVGLFHQLSIGRGRPRKSGVYVRGS